MSFALEIRNLKKAFGGLEVTRDVSLTLAAGARHALIGPNGAGKSTLVNLITGVLKPNAGEILLGGREIGNLSQAERVKRGLARTFQINSLFSTMTVAENVALAMIAHDATDARLLGDISKDARLSARIEEHLVRLNLAETADRLVSSLSYGQQRIVEVALALALQPNVLLLDEPAAGLAAKDVEILLGLLKGLPTTVSVLIIEHDMDLVFRFAETITVLVDGQVLMTGSPDAVRGDQRVRDVYLGRRHG
ncbi:branched-chain amino acid transport system ATP-binding protein [Neorhizobium sp. 2083]|uniref:ABC transporter ATP-binding protein n=1 Tax=Neorhizobium sp. 2083 TaxID=2817762 RepID=UPI00285F1B8F|nr:ABC transporter ATP-binding protein [Neorhizobium sp. 2083]MDR6817584.1 branched-chain amino acid transport system ATP-binding protein [Neorhizobium sp. 2083]